MATYAPPKKNTEYIMYVALEDQANAGEFKSNPTLAAGDVKVSKDGGALTNLATLPTVTPASSVMVKVTLSASEMNGDNVTVVFSDAAGDEWYDLVINLQTATKQFDDLSTFDSTTDTVDVGEISGSTTAADNLEASTLGIVTGAAQTGTLSTTQMTTNLTEATDDHYNGRAVLWTSGVLDGQASTITDYNGTSKMLTYDATTEAPANTDTFVIL